MRLGRALFTAFVVLATGRASAQDDDGRLARGFASAPGITGMRNLIDARVPEELSVRAQYRFSWQHEAIGGGDRSRTTDVRHGELMVGASAGDALDFGFQWPAPERVTVHTQDSGRTAKEVEAGAADPVFCGKVSLDLPPVALAPYAVVEAAAGAQRLEHRNELQLGLAAVATALRERVALHLNLALDARSGGTEGVIARLGVSGVPLAFRDAVMRVYVYGEELAQGVEVGHEVRVVAGVQLRLFGLLSLSVAFERRVYDDALPPGVHDRDTFGIRFGSGVSWTF